MAKAESAPVAAPAEAPAAAPAAAPATAPVAAPAKKKKTGLIVAIVIIVLALVGGGVAAFFLLNNKKDPVDAVIDAAKNTYKSIDKISLNERANVDAIAGSGMDLTIDGAINISGGLDANIGINAKISKDKDIAANLNLSSNGSNSDLAVVLKGDTLYVKENNLADILPLITQMSGGMFTIPAETKTALNMMNNMWIKSKAENLGGNSMVRINFSTAGQEDTIEKLRDNAVIEAYNGNEVQRKIGDLYKITPKEGSANSFGAPVFVEVKDNRLVRLYSKLDQEPISGVFDFTLSYDAVEISEPAGAIDLGSFGSGFSNPNSNPYSNPFNFDDDDDDDLDYDYDFDDLDFDNFDPEDLTKLFELYEKYSGNNNPESWDPADYQTVLEMMNKYGK